MISGCVRGGIAPCGHGLSRDVDAEGRMLGSLRRRTLTARRPSGLNEHASSDAFVGMTKAICVSADVTLTAKM